MKKQFYRVANSLFRKLQKLFGLTTLGVRAIVLNENNEFLLVKHTYDHGWFLPGGGVDRNESPQAAIKRELNEEVGICVIGEPKVFSCYHHKIFGATDVPILFIVLEFSQIEASSSEIEEYRWFKIEALPDTISPGSKRRLNEYFYQLPPAEMW